MKYYTSDLHLGHANIIEYENRPFKTVEEMDQALINNWNNKVKKGDVVYILGDFAFYKEGKKVNKILRKLNGQKHLIKGNHDYFLKDKEFDETLFVSVSDYKEVKDTGERVVLFHYPIAVWNGQHHDVIHLYGHIHGNQNTEHPLDIALEKAYNVGVDVNSFEPASLDELLEVQNG